MLKKARNDAERKKAQKELAKWQKNREDGVKELKKRQAMLDKALNDQRNYEKNLAAAKAQVEKAKQALDAAAKKTGLYNVLKSNKLDAKFAQFVILNDGTPRGLAEFAQKRSTNAERVSALFISKASSSRSRRSFW